MSQQKNNEGREQKEKKQAGLSSRFIEKMAVELQALSADKRDH